MQSSTCYSLQIFGEYLISVSFTGILVSPALFKIETDLIWVVQNWQIKNGIKYKIKYIKKPVVCVKCIKLV